MQMVAAQRKCAAGPENLFEDRRQEEFALWKAPQSTVT